METTTHDSPKAQFRSDGIRHATINGHRFHLRLTDPSKLNPLWIDGRSPLMLDQTAGEFIAFLIEAMWKFQRGDGDESDSVRQYVVDKMYAKYHRRIPLLGKKITRERISADLDRIFGTLMGLAEGACPVEAGLAMKEINPADWIAPARMDLAVTYKCNLKCPHCYLTKETAGVREELSFDDWMKVYDVLWKVGVPNVTFTGGEPTLRDDLVQLVSEADEFVTGLVTNGTKLEELAQSLKDVSLDYAQVTLESHQADIHNKMVAADFDAFSKTFAGIKKSLDVGLQVITNTTLTKQNADSFVSLIGFLKDLGIKNASCNTLICSGKGVDARKQDGLAMDDLKTILTDAVHAAQDAGINLQWYSPTCYLHLNPLELGFGAKGCSAAAYNMLTQPDGSVLPCQSWPDSVGNILREPWEKIWNHPTCKKLRAHGFISEKEQCHTCIHNEVCGGGCPLEIMEENQCK